MADKTKSSSARGKQMRRATTGEPAKEGGKHRRRDKTSKSSARAR